MKHKMTLTAFEVAAVLVAQYFHEVQDASHATAAVSSQSDFSQTATTYISTRHWRDLCPLIVHPSDVNEFLEPRCSARRSFIGGSIMPIL